MGAASRASQRLRQTTVRSCVTTWKPCCTNGTANSVEHATLTKAMGVRLHRSTRSKAT